MARDWLRAIVVTVLGMVLIAGLFWWRNRDERLRLEGQLQYITKQLHQQDSTQQAFLAGLSKKLDKQGGAVDTVIEHFHTTTDKILVPGRVDSVYLDTAFARLPDSTKVRILRELGTKTANARVAMK